MIFPIRTKNLTRVKLARSAHMNIYERYGEKRTQCPCLLTIFRSMSKDFWRPHVTQQLPRHLWYRRASSPYGNVMENTGTMCSADFVCIIWGFPEIRIPQSSSISNDGIFPVLVNWCWFSTVYLFIFSRPVFFLSAFIIFVSLFLVPCDFFLCARTRIVFFLFFFLCPEVFFFRALLVQHLASHASNGGEIWWGHHGTNVSMVCITK